MLDKLKLCAKCRSLKPLDAFAKHTKSADGLEYWCRECHNALAKEWYHKHKGPNILKTKRAEYLKMGFVPSMDVAKILNRAFGNGFEEMLQRGGVRRKPFRMVQGKQIYYYSVDDVKRLRDERAAEAVRRSSPVYRHVRRVCSRIVSLSRALEDLAAVLRQK